MFMKTVHTIVISSLLLLFCSTVLADEKTELPVDGSLTDLTGDDPYYYTKDQI